MNLKPVAMLVALFGALGPFIVTSSLFGDERMSGVPNASLWILSTVAWSAMCGVIAGFLLGIAGNRLLRDTITRLVLAARG